MQRISIIQGQHAVIAEPNRLIATVLGSCIAVCLYDPAAKVGGMNHFLLGDPAPGQMVNPQEMQRYGVHSMELLINEMMRRGAARQRLRAHVYGGAKIIAGVGGIGSSNAAFARRFIETEGIVIGHVDVGGNHARKVEFRPFEGKARSIAVTDLPPPPVAKPLLPAHAGDVELF